MKTLVLILLIALSSSTYALELDVTRAGEYVILKTSPELKNVIITTNPSSEWQQIGPGEWQGLTDAVTGHLFAVQCGSDYCRPYNIDFDIPPHRHWQIVRAGAICIVILTICLYIGIRYYE